MRKKKLLILSATDVAQCIQMKTAIDAMKKAFCQLSSGRAKVPLRTCLTIDEHDGISLFMPVYLPENKQIGLKTVCLFNQNPEKNLPLIHALVQVFDARTGEPLAVMDGEVLTAMRTGAVSGLATDLLAHPAASTVAVFGAGVQAQTQLEAVCAVRKIQQVFVFGRSEENASRFSIEMGSRLGISVTPVRQMELLKTVDVICTATTAATPVFAHEFLKPGVHINGVGSFRPDMCEVPAETVKQARVVVDQREACLSEAGDLIQPIDKGMIDKAHVSTEIGEVALGVKPGRTHPDEITFFKSVGNAVQDLGMATLILQRAADLGLGTSVCI